MQGTKQKKCEGEFEIRLQTLQLIRNQKLRNEFEKKREQFKCKNEKKSVMSYYEKVQKSHFFLISFGNDVNFCENTSHQDEHSIKLILENFGKIHDVVTE